jgi:histidyl-tRNA synthetase
VGQFAEHARLAAYEEISTPIFEEYGVFQRVGESTDVVSKEMYDFVDKGGRHMALRPELTAGVCRSFVENRPTALPSKVWYVGPQFRYEAPQKGRQRQFDQFDPDLDAEVIILAHRFLAGLGLTRTTLLVNTLGERAERARYVDVLRSYFESVRGDLSEQSQQTLDRNPLRVLDSKRREDAPIIASAPLITEVLSDRSSTFFDRVLGALGAGRVEFEVAPRLVRGLDYYCHTTFEFADDALAAAQNAVGGGGRYDGLVESLGGPPTPGVGFAIGVDRTLLACDAESVFAEPAPAVDVFVVDVTDGRAARDMVDELRQAGIAADRSWAQEFDAEGSRQRSMKAQMKAAGRSGARLAAIVGEDELSGRVVVLRDLDASTQTLVGREELVAAVLALVSVSED